MQINKKADAGMGTPVTEEELELINAQSRKKLGADEIYTFGVRLCDNEVDRDNERFALKTLEELSALFVGKSGVFDHEWSARGQTARIYRTELVREKQTKTAAGDMYCSLKGYAYMLRTEGNRDLIAEIEGGIKREVSVGCAVQQAKCSICGEDIHDRQKCSHVKGRDYNGKKCWAELEGATDAFEWSFVAVPAQKRAGVMKTMRKEGVKVELKEFLREQPEYLGEVERLEAEAETGRHYLAGLRAEVARLGGICESGMETAVMKSITEALGERELEELKKAYEKRLEERYPTGPQLKYESGKKESDTKDGAFLI